MPKKEKEHARKTRGPFYNYYTPLNDSQSRILEQALATEFFMMPKQANPP